MRLALGRFQNKEADPGGANPTRGGWIGQAQPTKRAARPLCFLLSLSPRTARREKARKTEIPGTALCRLKLNDPPTAVGGIPISTRILLRLLVQPLRLVRLAVNPSVSLMVSAPCHSLQLPLRTQNKQRCVVLEFSAAETDHGLHDPVSQLVGIKLAVFNQ